MFFRRMARCLTGILVCAGAPAAGPATKPGAAPAVVPVVAPTAAPLVVVKKVDGATVTGTLDSLRDGTLTLGTKGQKSGGGEKLPDQTRISLDEIAEVIHAGKPATQVNAGNSPKRDPKVKPPATPPPTPDTVSSAEGVPASQPGIPRCAITLITNDVVHGSLAEWSEKHLSLKTPLAAGGSLQIPIEQVREFWLGTADQVKQAKAIKLQDGPEDAAYVLKDGAPVVVRGVALGIEGESLRFKFNDQERKIGLSKLVGVTLGGQDARKDDSFRFAVQLVGGQIVSGSWKTLEKNVLGIEAGWGGKFEIPFAKVLAVRGINGRLVYLSDVKPSRVEQTPFFDRLIPWKADHSLLGGSLKLTDGEYTKGLAVHSRCVLEYELGAKYETFATKVGFQVPEGRLGRAVVRVLGDGRMLYEDLDARGDALKPAEVSVTITGMNRLTLEVDFGKNEDTGDRVVWANARVLRATKATTGADKGTGSGTVKTN